MKGPNLSAWAISHGSVMRFALVLTLIAGVFAYLTLGRQEDPDFTMKNMIVSAAWPGASAQEMADQVAEPIERAIQTLPEVQYLRTNVQPGRVIVNIKVRESVRSEVLPDVWNRVRQRVQDRAAQMPHGVVGPQFNDDFGDTYGNIYALSGDGYSLPQLKTYGDLLRDQFRQLSDVGRVEFEGEPQERIYVEYNAGRLATLGIDPQRIVQTIRDTNTVAPSGVIDLEKERVRIDVTGTFDNVEAIRQMSIAANGRSLRLGDIATVRRALTDPPTSRMRFDGRDAVGVMVSLRKGGNVSRLGKQSEALVADFRAQLPVGVNLDVVANQPQVVKGSINEFTMSLLEAVIIVLAVSFLSLGWRPGIVVALCIPIVFALTFMTMLALGIPLHRVSLGALIVALGLLVDDAIIVVEQIDTHLLSGWEKVRAVTSAYLVTAQPMLIGTVITMLGFLPISMANSAAGEYASSIFSVVAIALGFSWIVAVFVTPYISNAILKPGKKGKAAGEGGSGGGHGSYDGPFYTRFRMAVCWAMDHRKLVILVTVGLFVLSLGLFAKGVPKQFFPTSDRPELIVDLRTPQNTSFAQTLELTQRLEKLLADDPDVVSVTAYVGGGTPRFYLALDVQMPNIALAQVVVMTTGGAGRDRVEAKIEKALATQFPEARTRISTLELGPPVGQPFKVRLTAPTYEAIAEASETLERVMREHPRLADVNRDYGDTIKTVHVEVDQDKARALGITSLDIERALQSALDGLPITQYNEGKRVLDVVARLTPYERTQLDRFSQLQVPTAGGQSVPLSQVARLSPGFEVAELNRRSSMPTITVQADPVGTQPDAVAKSLKADLQAVRASLPANATLTIGGSMEESAASQGSVFKQVPVAFLLILMLLIIQLQSNKKMLLVVLTGPLALIGVAIILTVFRIPFGFVAMLGGLSLFGMVIRNSVILVSQIEALEAEGMGLYEAIVEATVHRFRPIMLTALAAILAMIPLTRSVFWGPMAWSIMGGLMVATVLTLIFLPAAYGAVYRARRAPKIEVEHG